MNETLLSRIGKLFFPRLAPDQRHQRMIVMFLVVSVTLISGAVLISWIMSTGVVHIHFARPAFLSGR